MEQRQSPLLATTVVWNTWKLTCKGRSASSLCCLQHQEVGDAYSANCIRHSNLSPAYNLFSSSQRQKQRYHCRLDLEGITRFWDTHVVPLHRVADVFVYSSENLCWWFEECLLFHSSEQILYLLTHQRYSRVDFFPYCLRNCGYRPPAFVGHLSDRLLCTFGRNAGKTCKVCYYWQNPTPSH